MNTIDERLAELRERMSIINTMLRALAGGPAADSRPRFYVVDGGGQTTPDRALLGVIR